MITYAIGLLILSTPLVVVGLWLAYRYGFNASLRDK